ncbi:hypothetical protein BDV3_001491 [Batrachochytrium dendrobatidis]
MGSSIDNIPDSPAVSTMPLETTAVASITANTSKPLDATNDIGICSEASTTTKSYTLTRSASLSSVKPLPTTPSKPSTYLSAPTSPALPSRGHSVSPHRMNSVFPSAGSSCSPAVLASSGDPLSVAWDTHWVQRILEENGLGQYKTLFVLHGIHGQKLTTLSYSTLKDMGIVSLPDRTRILQIIRAVSYNDLVSHAVSEAMNHSLVSQVNESKPSARHHSDEDRIHQAQHAHLYKTPIGVAGINCTTPTVQDRSVSASPAFVYNRARSPIRMAASHKKTLSASNLFAGSYLGTAGLRQSTQSSDINPAASGSATHTLLLLDPNQGAPIAIPHSSSSKASINVSQPHHSISTLGGHTGYNQPKSDLFLKGESGNPIIPPRSPRSSPMVLTSNTIAYVPLDLAPPQSPDSKLKDSTLSSHPHPTEFSIRGSSISPIIGTSQGLSDTNPLRNNAYLKGSSPSVLSQNISQVPAYSTPIDPDNLCLTKQAYFTAASIPGSVSTPFIAGSDVIRPVNTHSSASSVDSKQNVSFSLRLDTHEIEMEARRSYTNLKGPESAVSRSEVTPWETFEVTPWELQTPDTGSSVGVGSVADITVMDTTLPKQPKLRDRNSSGFDEEFSSIEDRNDFTVKPVQSRLPQIRTDLGYNDPPLVINTGHFALRSLFNFSRPTVNNSPIKQDIDELNPQALSPLQNSGEESPELLSGGFPRRTPSPNPTFRGATIGSFPVITPRSSSIKPMDLRSAGAIALAMLDGDYTRVSNPLSPSGRTEHSFATSNGEMSSVASSTVSSRKTPDIRTTHALNEKRFGDSKRRSAKGLLASGPTSPISPTYRDDIMNLEGIRAKCIRVYDVRRQSHIFDVSGMQDPAKIREKILAKFNIKSHDRYELYIEQSTLNTNRFVRDTSIDDATLMEICLNPDHPYRSHLMLELPRSRSSVPRARPSSRRAAAPIVPVDALVELLDGPSPKTSRKKPGPSSSSSAGNSKPSPRSTSTSKNLIKSKYTPVTPVRHTSLPRGKSKKHLDSLHKSSAEVDSIGSSQFDSDLDPALSNTLSDVKETRSIQKLASFFGESVPTDGSNMLNAPFEKHQRNNSRFSIRVGSSRASTISRNAPHITSRFDPDYTGAVNLRSTKKLESFFGDRPPTHEIANNLEKYFPGIEQLKPAKISQKSGDKTLPVIVRETVTMKRTSRIQLQQQHNQNMTKKLLSSTYDISAHPVPWESFEADASSNPFTPDQAGSLHLEPAVIEESMDLLHNDTTSIKLKPDTLPSTISEETEENINSKTSSKLSDHRTSEQYSNSLHELKASDDVSTAVKPISTAPLPLESDDLISTENFVSDDLSLLNNTLKSNTQLPNRYHLSEETKGGNTNELISHNQTTTADLTDTSLHVPSLRAPSIDLTSLNDSKVRIEGSFKNQFHKPVKRRTRSADIDGTLDHFHNDADDEQEAMSKIEDSSDDEFDMDEDSESEEELTGLSKVFADGQALSANGLSCLERSDSINDYQHTFATHPDTPRNVQWIKGPLIGAGSFGKVFYGVNCETGEIMAVKQVPSPTYRVRTFSRSSGDSTSSRKLHHSTHDEAVAKARRKMLEALHREISLLKDLDHENIVRYLGFDVETDFISVFLEYVSGGSVSTALAVMGNFEEPLIQSIVSQVLNGLRYLHERLIIHRDIKGGNILIDEDGWAKISDFGISKKNKHQMAYRYNSRMSIQGSVYWMAPEVIKSKGYSAKVDIWSLGCVVLEMFTGNHPWRQLDEVQTMWRLGREDKPPLPEHLSSMGTDFLTKTFVINPEERPTAAELEMHPFCLFDPTTFDFRAYKEEAIQRKQLMDLMSSGTSIDEDEYELEEDIYEDDGEVDKVEDIYEGAEQEDGSQNIAVTDADNEVQDLVLLDADDNDDCQTKPSECRQMYQTFQAERDESLCHISTHSDDDVISEHYTNTDTLDGSTKLGIETDYSFAIVPISLESLPSNNVQTIIPDVSNPQFGFTDASTVVHHINHVSPDFDKNAIQSETCLSDTELR